MQGILYFVFIISAPCKCFIAVLISGISWEFVWQQVSWSLQYSLEHSTQSCNATVWRVLILPLFSNSFSLFFQVFGTVPRAPTTISITNTFMFYIFFSSPARSKYLSIFSLSFIFSLWFAQSAGAVVRPPTNKCPGYDTKQSDGEVPVMLEIWGMQSTSSLLSLSGPL